jgi:2-polyprenyl-6-methoxyphenol hydroxylase-like FAD-dependent oxidoreductase
MAPLEILIVGCSVAGTTLSSFLLLSPVPAAAKPHITILERSSKLRTQGQNVDVRGAGVAVIRKLGLEKVIRESTTGEEGVQ